MNRRSGTWGDAPKVVLDLIKTGLAVRERAQMETDRTAAETAVHKALPEELKAFVEQIILLAREYTALQRGLIGDPLRANDRRVGDRRNGCSGTRGCRGLDRDPWEPGQRHRPGLYRLWRQRLRRFSEGRGPRAWTPLFYAAVAVVTETGGPLSHGAVTAREARIPAVMAVRDVLRSVKNGDILRVDGSTGRVFRET